MNLETWLMIGSAVFLFVAGDLLWYYKNSIEKEYTAHMDQLVVYRGKILVAEHERKQFAADRESLRADQEAYVKKNSEYESGVAQAVAVSSERFKDLQVVTNNLRTQKNRLLRTVRHDLLPNLPKGIVDRFLTDTDGIEPEGIEGVAYRFRSIQ